MLFFGYKDRPGLQLRHFFGLNKSQVLQETSQYSHVVPVSIVCPEGHSVTQVLLSLFNFRGVLHELQVSRVSTQDLQFELHETQVSPSKTVPNGHSAQHLY